MTAFVGLNGQYDISYKITKYIDDVDIHDMYATGIYNSVVLWIDFRLNSYSGKKCVCAMLR